MIVLDKYQWTTDNCQPTIRQLSIVHYPLSIDIKLLLKYNCIVAFPAHFQEWAQK